MPHMGRVLLAGFWLCLLVGCGTPAASIPPSGSEQRTTSESGSATLTVFAAASLTEAFGEIGQRFEQTHGAKVAFNFAGSQQLAQQLAQGAPADVFASANQKELDNAIAAGAVVSGTQQIFARNRLVVIVPQDNRANIKTLHDLARPGVKLAFAAAQVPVGAYTQQALAKMSADPAFGTDFQAKVNANVVTQEENVKSVVTKVSLGEVDGGVAYATDVTPTVSAKIVTVTIPDAFNQLAAYPIAPTKNPPAGKVLADQFVDLVLSPEGQRILERYHFVVAGSG